MGWYLIYLADKKALTSLANLFVTGSLVLKPR